MALSKDIEEIEKYLEDLKTGFIEYNSTCLYMRKGEIIYLFFNVEVKKIYLNHSLLSGSGFPPLIIINYIKNRFSIQGIRFGWL